MPPVVALLVVTVLAATPARSQPLSALEGALAGTVGGLSVQDAGEILGPLGPAGRLPPGPLVVEPAPAPPAGMVRIEPGVVRLHAAAGESLQPELLIMNGAEWPLDLALTTTDVMAGPDGVPTPVTATEGTGAVAPSAATWVQLPASALHLDPGEQARLRPTVSVPHLAAPGGYLTALRVAGPPRGGGADSANSEVAAFLLVEVPGIGGEAGRRLSGSVALTRRGFAGAVARARLEAEQTEVVTGRLKVGSWWDAALIEVPIPATVVLATAPRIQEVGFRAPLLPGPYELTAILETSAGEALSLHASAWLWNPLATLIVAVMVLVLGVAISKALRHARSPN
ncbi:MAG: hypothetical protein ABR592_13375 [Nitriliruptorales bacterium]